MLLVVRVPLTSWHVLWKSAWPIEEVLQKDKLIYIMKLSAACNEDNVVPVATETVMIVPGQWTPFENFITYMLLVVYEKCIGL